MNVSFYYCERLSDQSHVSFELVLLIEQLFTGILTERTYSSPIDFNWDNSGFMSDAMVDDIRSVLYNADKRSERFRFQNVNTLPGIVST